MSPDELVKSPHNSPPKLMKSPGKSVLVILPTNSLLSSTKEEEFKIESSTIFENEYSLGAYISSAEFETTFDNLRMLHDYNYVTGPEKTGLIYIKYTYSYYGAYLSSYTLYLNSVSFNEQLRIF